jgi:hypothetical protein
MNAEHCRRCGHELTDTRFALARARTGDLVFCGGACWRDWEASAVNRVERFRMEQMWLTVATEAILHRHPAAVWIADHSRGLPIPLKDDALEAAVERIGLWLADRPDLPVDPDSALARQRETAGRAVSEG